jgi:hypothetical protein
LGGDINLHDCEEFNSQNVSLTLLKSSVYSCVYSGSFAYILNINISKSFAMDGGKLIYSVNINTNEFAKISYNFIKLEGVSPSCLIKNIILAFSGSTGSLVTVRAGKLSLKNVSVNQEKWVESFVSVLSSSTISVSYIECNFTNSSYESLNGSAALIWVQSSSNFIKVNFSSVTFCNISMRLNLSSAGVVRFMGRQDGNSMSCGVIFFLIYVCIYYDIYYIYILYVCVCVCVDLTVSNSTFENITHNATLGGFHFYFIFNHIFLKQKKKKKIRYTAYKRRDEDWRDPQLVISEYKRCSEHNQWWCFIHQHEHPSKH